MHARTNKKFTEWAMLKCLKTITPETIRSWVIERRSPALLFRGQHPKPTGRVLLDVRSPSEFSHAHIPNSLNLPLFSDEERAIVGTLYKRESPEVAFQQGLDFVLPKIPHFVETFNQSCTKGNETGASEVIFYCARGGLRSASLAYLFSSGIIGDTSLDLSNVSIVEGGYKSYRQEVLNFFAEPSSQSLPSEESVYNVRLIRDKAVVLGGYTGSGKTEILKKLEELGELVVDLEGLANHKGSSFGSLGTLHCIWFFFFSCSFSFFFLFLLFFWFWFFLLLFVFLFLLFSLFLQL